MSRLNPCHRATRHGKADINFAADEGWQNQRPRWKLGVRKSFQIKAAGFPFIRIPAFRTTLVLVRWTFTVSGESRQKNRIIKEADSHRRRDHRDENPEAHREKSCKDSAHRRCWTDTSVRVLSQGVYSPVRNAHRMMFPASKEASCRFRDVRIWPVVWVCYYASGDRRLATTSGAAVCGESMFVSVAFLVIVALVTFFLTTVGAGEAWDWGLGKGPVSQAFSNFEAWCGSQDRDCKRAGQLALQGRRCGRLN